jgi:hypothetical protein
MDELNGYHHGPQLGHTPQLQILMGRVLERSEMSLVRLDRIDARLVKGDETMASLAARIDKLETSSQPTSGNGSEKSLGDRFDAGMTRAERLCKLVATYLLPTLLALLTLPLPLLGR